MTLTEDGLQQTVLECNEAPPTRNHDQPRVGQTNSIRMTNGGGNTKRGEGPALVKKGTNTKARRTRHKSGKNKNMQMAVINIRGMKGKVKSLESLLTSEKIGIAIISETHLQNKETAHVKGYTWTGKNRTKTQGGGVGILIRNDLTGITVSEETPEDEEVEIKWVQLKLRPKNIYIGAFYGPQESAPKEILERTYATLEAHINCLKTKGEVIIAGDFNAKLRVEHQGITQEESQNGTRLQGIIDRHGLTTLNRNPSAGLWTRVNRKNTQERSVIDYIIMTKDTAASVTSTIVDEEGSLRIKGKNETDHNTILTNIRINQPRTPHIIKKWKLENNEGWEKFSEVITKGMKELNNKTHGTKQEMYNKFENMVKRTLKSTVGERVIDINKPTKIKSEEIQKLRAAKKKAKKKFETACKTGQPAEKRETLEDYQRHSRKLREAIEKEEQKRLDEKLKKISEEAKHNPNIIWKLRRKIIKKKELEYEIMDEEGNTISNPEEAKEHVASYFQELYQARPGTHAYKKWTEYIKQKVANLSQKYQNNREPGEEITNKELNEAIRKLKRKKATGPDSIPNEIFIEASGEARNEYRKMMNGIYQEEEIPDQWQLGEITRLYKGKGTKGKCSNERGITLASNVGKVFERIINHRIKPNVHITEFQAGGQEGAATSDHLTVLKEAINHIRGKKQTAYVIFLDVQKAYDKAWLDAIMYAMDKCGLKGKNWEITRKLNSNLKAKIKTKHGHTREIKIKDSIRQGGVLSVIQYATIIDEIAKELTAKNLGIDLPGQGKLGCLLWMDDVTLIHNDPKELQKMLDVTNDIAMRYHIEFGAPKCKVVKIGPGKPSKIKLGNTVLEETDSYKYLGEIFNKNGNNKDHIEAIRNKVNGAYSNILATTGTCEFKGIKMKSIWKLVDTCIIPIITYGAEAANHNKKEKEAIQQIFNDLLKRILNLPQPTPNTNLLIETGYLPIEYLIDRKKIMQANRIARNEKSSLVKKVTQVEESRWMKGILELLNKYKMEEEDLQLTKHQLKTKIYDQQVDTYKAEIEEESKNKSKLKYLLDNINEIQIGKRPAYMDELTRKQCAAIACVRTRMVPVKNNHKGSHTDLTCRWCKNSETEETQDHVLSSCQGNEKIMENQIEFGQAFKSHPQDLRECAEKITKMIDYIKDGKEKKSPRPKNNPTTNTKTK